MANPWFRLHADILTNRKLLRLTHVEQRHYIWLLALKSNGVLEGWDLSCGEDAALLEKVVAHDLWITPARARKLKQRLLAVNLIDTTWQPVGWDNRQYISSKSKDSNASQPKTDAERAREYRENKKSRVTGVTNSVTQASRENVTLVTALRARETDIQITDEQRTTTTGASPVVPHAQARATPAPEPPVDNFEKPGGFATDRVAEPTENLTFADPKPDKPRRARRKKPDNELSVDDVVADCGALRQHVQDWFTAGRRGVPLTPTAWSVIVHQANKAGITTAQAVQVSAENSWRGFHASWYLNLNASHGRRGQADTPITFDPANPINSLIKPATHHSFGIAKHLVFNPGNTNETI